MEGLNVTTIKAVSTQEYAIQLVQSKLTYMVYWVRAGQNEGVFYRSSDNLNTALAIFTTTLFDLEGASL